MQTDNQKIEPVDSSSQNLEIDKPDRHPSMVLTWPFAILGRKTLGLVDNLGAAAIFLAKAFVMIFRVRQIPGIVLQCRILQNFALIHYLKSSLRPMIMSI